jgi:hypothetical protein
MMSRIVVAFEVQMKFRRKVFLLLLSALIACVPAYAAVSVNSSGDSTPPPPNDATLILSESLFQAMLDAIFAESSRPEFPISAQADTRETVTNVSYKPTLSTTECASVIRLEREVDGNRTAIRFVSGRIRAPLAFSGSYNVPLMGCVNFRGWADANMTLFFDGGRQSLNGKVTVEEIHLVGLPTMANGSLVPLVQAAVDRKFNPVTILRESQLSASLPISGSNKTLRLRAREIQPEIRDRELRLHIVYEFKAE